MGAYSNFGVGFLSEIKVLSGLAKEMHRVARKLTFCPLSADKCFGYCCANRILFDTLDG